MFCITVIKKVTLHSMKHIEALIKKIENISTSLPQTLLLFGTSIFIRTFFENFTNSNNAGVLNSMTDTFLHYPLWYGGVFLSVIIIFYVLTKQDLMKIANVVAIGSFGILLAPLVDIFAHGFLGQPYNFIAGNYQTLWQHFSSITFSTSAISLGLKIETVLAILSTGLYVYVRSDKKRLLKAFIAGGLSYIVLFFFLSLPTHTMSLFNTITETPSDLTSEGTVLFYTPPSYTLEKPSDIAILNKHSIEQQYFSQKISIVFTIIIVAFLSLLLALKNKKKLVAILKNIRPSRLLNLYIFTGAGLYFSLQTNIYELHAFYTTIDIVALFVSIAMAWLFAVWENDEADLVIDNISNPARPLVSGAINKKEWLWVKNIFLTFALLLSFLVGQYVFTTITLFILIYHIYSVKPLRLKKIPGLSSLLVVMNSLLLFLAGFFAGNINAELYDLPFSLILGIFIIYLLVENIKNMKDIAGDKADHVYTLPVLLGNKAGLGMSMLTFVSSLFAIIYFNFSSTMTVVTVLFTLGIIFFLNKKPYREAPLFLLYFIFLIIVFFIT